MDGFRVDATPYLYEREGTNCENLPETHAYLKRLRAFVDAYAPGTLLLSEANQWPEDVRHYFGDGDEFHMNFHFPFMPRVFMALAKADRAPMTPPLGANSGRPASCQWATFLRYHDELTVEMVSLDERGSCGNSSRPTRACGLIWASAGASRRLSATTAPIELANALLLSLLARPASTTATRSAWATTSGSVTAMAYAPPCSGTIKLTRAFPPPIGCTRPSSTDDRFSYRHVNVQAQQADPDSLFNALRHMIAVRKQHPAFGRGDFAWAEVGSPAVAAYWRTLADDRVLMIHNLSDQAQPIELADQPQAWLDLLTQSRLTPHVSLQPYQFLWLVAR